MDYRADAMIAQNKLRHFGILGMKWGVRRYQNKDGSLTEEGRKRYGMNSDKLGLSDKEIDAAVGRASKTDNYDIEFLEYIQNDEDLMNHNNKEKRLDAYKKYLKEYQGEESDFVKTQERNAIKKAASDYFDSGDFDKMLKVYKSDEKLNTAFYESGLYEKSKKIANDIIADWAKKEGVDENSHWYKKSLESCEDVISCWYMQKFLNEYRDKQKGA